MSALREVSSDVQLRGRMNEPVVCVCVTAFVSLNYSKWIAMDKWRRCNASCANEHS